MYFYRIHNGKDTKGKHKFNILDKNKQIVIDKKILEYINNLVIPPAYKDVTIYYEKNPKILFEGYDDKNRKQQIYSQDHKKKSSKKKFCHLLEFGIVLPKILTDVEKNMKIKEFTKEKIISLIIKIIIKCGFRVGNLKYQKLYNSFGISNIFKEHIHIKKVKNKEVLQIKFIGKKGVLNECEITNENIINEIKKLILNKTNKDYVFTYEKNELVSNDKEEVIKSIDINNWLKKYNGNITSKMFRTFDTNILFIQLMRDKDNPCSLSINQRKKNVICIMKIISNQINNTPNVCKKEYLHPDIWNLYIDYPKKYKQFFNGCDTPMLCFLNYLETYCK
jgi:DNA topoisomerase-1